MLLCLSAVKAQCAPLAQLDRASGYGPEGRGFESLTACQKAREILGFHELFLFSSAFVFPRKWSSRTAIRSGSILPQNTVTAAFACRDGKHDFYACVDQKNHRIFRCQRNYPLKIQIILLSAGELVLHRPEKSYKLLWNHVSK